MLSSLIALIISSAAALAGPPACPWEGEASDPFTGLDGRHLQAQMRLSERGSSFARFHIHHAVDGQVRSAGAITQLRHSLLSNGTVTRELEPRQSEAMRSAKACVTGE